MSGVDQERVPIALVLQTAASCPLPLHRGGFFRNGWITDTNSGEPVFFFGEKDPCWLSLTPSSAVASIGGLSDSGSPVSRTSLLPGHPYSLKAVPSGNMRSNKTALRIAIYGLYQEAMY